MNQALGGVGCFRCFSPLGGTGQGEPWHRSSQRFSALGCHLPGHEGAEVRRALAAALTTFATEIDATLVAEGIESGAELDTLRNLGILWGQGYFLARPAPLP